MPSFDIVSEVNMQEVDNAVNQATKEIQSRYDFKGSNAEIKWDKKEFNFIAEDEYKLGAMKTILQQKLVKRGIDIVSLKYEEVIPTSHKSIKQNCKISQGIDKEAAKKITSAIRDSKLKVSTQIKDEKIQVTSKSIDSLQECIAFLRSKNFGLPLQYNNMRS